MQSERYRKKIRIFCDFAKSLGELSVCRRHSCACVIFNTLCTRVLSIGYNGPPSDAPHSDCTGEIGTCGCIHAEVNAITKLDAIRAYPALLYSTVEPCHNCANLIINSRVVVAVIYTEACRHDWVTERFERNGIPSIMEGNITDEKLLEWWSLGRAYR